MAQSVLKCWNQAVSALGVGEVIGAEDEISVAARQCNIWYESVRDAVFRAAPWASLTGYSRLATQAIRDTDEDWVGTDPTPGFGYAFKLPANFIRPRYLSSFGQFEMANVGDTPVLVTQEATPILTYTRRDIAVANWDVDLFLAVSFGLAAHIAKGITGNDADLANMFQLAQEKILQARTNNANQQNQQAESIPTWIQARGNNISMPSARYLYPSAEFSMMGSMPLG